MSLVLIGLMINGSVRMTDNAWPFGPLSQYAFAPPADSTIEITRVEGLLDDGRRIDLPLRVGVSGISRAEIEARTGAIVENPVLLRSVVDGWSVRHQGEPAVQQVWLVQDRTTVVRNRPVATELVELATWVVPQ